jgi:hypothetical protein
MKGRALLIGVVLPVLAGCFSYTRPWAYTMAPIADAKQGQDCRVLIFGVGEHDPDVTLAQAIRLGGITKLRSGEYRVNTLQGTGTECVVVHGE